MNDLPHVTSPEEIARAVERVVARFNPLQVVLFGSHARGLATVDSDVDLLVMMETNQRPVDQAVEIRDHVDFPFAVDRLVRTPAQVAERLRIGDDFMQEIVAEGIVLYETAASRIALSHQLRSGDSVPSCASDA